MDENALVYAVTLLVVFIDAAKHTTTDNELLCVPLTPDNEQVCLEAFSNTPSDIARRRFPVKQLRLVKSETKQPRRLEMERSLKFLIRNGEEGTNELLIFFDDSRTWIRVVPDLDGCHNGVRRRICKVRLHHLSFRVNGSNFCFQVDSE